MGYDQAMLIIRNPYSYSNDKVRRAATFIIMELNNVSEEDQLDAEAVLYLVDLREMKARLKR